MKTREIPPCQHHGKPVHPLGGCLLVSFVRPRPVARSARGREGAVAGTAALETLARMRAVLGGRESASANGGATTRSAPSSAPPTTRGAPPIPGAWRVGVACAARAARRRRGRRRGSVCGRRRRAHARGARRSARRHCPYGREAQSVAPSHVLVRQLAMRERGNAVLGAVKEGKHHSTQAHEHLSQAAGCERPCA